MLPVSHRRDHREVTVRLERGFLATAATGYTSPEAADEFERCLQLVGEEPSLEMFGIFSALWGHYTARGQLDRATRLFEALRQLEGASDWATPIYNAVAGFLAMFRGRFDDSRAELEAAVEALDRHVVPQIAQTWYTPSDRISGLYAELGFVRFVQGDLAAAEPAFARIASRCQELTFPGNEVSFCYGRAREATVRIEAGQLDQAAAIFDDIARRAEQHDLREWAMVAASFRASMAARKALADGES